MSPVDFKKIPCRPVEFKGQGPLSGADWGDKKTRKLLEPFDPIVRVVFYASSGPEDILFACSGRPMASQRLSPSGDTFMNNQPWRPPFSIGALFTKQ